MLCFRNDVAPPSWTLILPKSWDESKTDFKGEVDGFKIEEVEGSPLVFPLAIQDSGGRDQCTPGRRRQMLLFFCGRFSWSRQTSLSKGFSDYFHDSTTELYFRSTTPNSPMSMLFQNKNN